MPNHSCSCTNCHGEFFNIRLPRKARTFCGFPIPKGKRHLCSLKMERGDFERAPIFEDGGKQPEDCPMLTGKTKGGK